MLSGQRIDLSRGEEPERRDEVEIEIDGRADRCLPWPAAIL
jgi:hypothetical protein